MYLRATVGFYFAIPNGCTNTHTHTHAHTHSHSHSPCPQGDTHKASTPSILADADLGRMLVCHFMSLMRASPSLPAEAAARAEAQLISLHTALTLACPRFALHHVIYMPHGRHKHLA